MERFSLCIYVCIHVSVMVFIGVIENSTEVNTKHLCYSALMLRPFIFSNSSTERY